MSTLPVNPMRTVSAVILAAMVWVPAVATAQAPAYRRSAADTLWYQEASRATIDVTTPQGDINVRSRTDAKIAVTFGVADTARAWYDELSISAESPQGQQAPTTDEVLRQPFLLKLQSDGTLETLSTPPLPESFQGVSDIARQFDDFFVRLPDTPLTSGTAWTDTVRVNAATSTGGRVSTERISRYEVVGDSVIDGASAVVVRAAVRTQLNSTGPSGMPETEMMSVLRGEEQGTFYFDAAAGRMLGRSQTGDLSGDLQFIGPEPVSLGQRIRYERTLRLLR
ncbi:MAG TPA: hypothetical protein VFZ18_14865 [Longimicrobiaceae bacterium]